MNTSGQLSFPAKLTIVFAGVFLAILITSNIFGIATPGLIGSLFLWAAYMVVGIFLFAVSPILFILALIKPAWFGLADAGGTLKKFLIFWFVGMAVLCMSLLLLSKLTLPNLESTSWWMMIITLFISLNIVLLNWITPIFTRRSQRTQQIVMVGLGAFLFVGVIISGFFQKVVPSDILDAAATVCRGQSIPEAAGYLDNEGIQKIIVLYERGNSYKWASLMPEGTWPESLEDLVLVACLGSETSKEIQTCGYIGGPSITRYRYQQEIRLISAKTGEVIKDGVVLANDPSACPQSADQNKTTIKGPTVDKGNIQDWLRDFIHP